MDEKLKELLARTNVDELVSPAARALDLNQPVASAPEPKPRTFHSTTDPLQIHFAAADVLGKITTSRTPRWMRLVGMVVVCAPLAVIGLETALGAWMVAPGEILVPQTPREFARVVLGTLAFVLLAVATPWLVYRAARRS
jgi:hypothetical protein